MLVTPRQRVSRAKDLSGALPYNEAMTTRRDLEDALKQAMRAKDDLRKRTLRMALAAIQLAEVEKPREATSPMVLLTVGP